MELQLASAQIPDSLKRAGIFRGSVDELFVYLVNTETKDSESGYLCLMEPIAANRCFAQKLGYLPAGGTLFKFNRSRTTKAPQTISIRLSSSLQSCFIADVNVPCSDVGAKLRAMNVPISSDIRLTGDIAANYQLVHATVDSLHRAGFSTKVAVLTH